MRFAEAATRCRAYNEAGDVIQLTDENGSVFDSTYDPLGRKVQSLVTKATDAVGTDSQTSCDTIFTGRQFDAESGVYQYRVRYYASVAGRFTSRDPVPSAASRSTSAAGLNVLAVARQTEGSPATLGAANLQTYAKTRNLFEYVEGNPSVATDPTGKFLFNVYGNFCGWSRYGQGGGPIDSLDAACEEHDDCLATIDETRKSPCLLVTCHAPLCRAGYTALNGGCSSEWPAGPDRMACLNFAARLVTACSVSYPSYLLSPLPPW